LKNEILLLLKKTTKTPHDTAQSAQPNIENFKSFALE